MRIILPLKKTNCNWLRTGSYKAVTLSFAFFIIAIIPLKAQNCSVNAGVDFSVCANSILTLGGGKAGVFQGAGIINWSQVAGPSAVITTPSSLITTVTSLVGGNIYKFRLSATCSDGSLVFDEVSVTVQSISISNAGPDQTFCPANGVYSMSASPLNVGETGVWTTVSGSSSQIVTSSSPTTKINVLSTSSGNTTFRWTVTNGTCSSFDDVIITNRGGTAVVTAGIDQSLSGCYGTTQTATLAGSLGGGGVALGQSGLWTIVDGPNVPTITTPASNASTISNLIQGIYTFRWTVSGTCVNGTDVMQITVPAANGGVTTASISPASTAYCDGRTAVVLAGSVPTKPNETVLWTRSGAAGGTIDSPTSTTINVTGLVPGATYANSSTFTYTITNNNSGCISVSNPTSKVSWTAPPVLNVTTPSPLLLGCGVTSATINYTTSGGTTTQWMILSGPVTPSYPVIPTALATLGASPVTLSGFTKPGTYQIRIQKNASSCSPVFQDFTLIVAPTPTSSNAGTDQVLACNANGTNLVGNAPSVGTGTWTQVSGPNTANMPSPNLNNSPISGLISGKYTFRWLISTGNSCPNTQNDVSVIVSDPSPTASAAGSDLTICNSSPLILSGNPVKLNETGTWTVNPSAGVSITDNHSPNTEASGMAPNTPYIFTWTISNACGVSSDNVVITTNSVAGPIPSLAGTDQCLPSGTTSVTMAGNAPDPGTGTWTQLSGSPGTITTPSQYNTTITALSNGTSTFEWAITRNSCTVTRDTVVITISGPTTTANAGPDQSVCGAGTMLAGNNPAIGTGYWTQISGSGGVILSDPLLTGASLSGLVPGSYIFRWKISNNQCSSNSDDVQINVSTPPTVANAGPDQSICSGSSITMAGNAITAGSGLWTIVSGPNAPVITTPGSPTTTMTGLTNGTYDIRWRSYNGAYCPASTDDVIVDVTQAVTPVLLGNNQTLCASSSTTLQGVLSSTGTWTQDAGPNSATITAFSPNNALATGLIPGIYTFRYTYDFVTACTNTGTITVTILAMPNPASAGPDLNVCDVNSLNMAGNAATSGAGLWTKTSGPAGPVIVSTTSPTTSITNLVNGTYVYKWTITNGICITSDDIIINRSSSLTVANAGADQLSVCGTVATMAANTPAPGVGSWSQLSGPNTATISSTILPNTTITGMITGTYVFRWSITNGFCSPSTDDVSITMFETPTAANAGPDQTLCGNASTALAGNTILLGAGQWSQVSGPNSAIITTDSDPATTIWGLMAGTYVFKWTSTNGTCSSNDNVSIFITDTPTVSVAGADQNICLFSPLTLSANTPVIGTGLWSQISGSPAIIQSPATASTSITGVSAGTYGFRWTIINGTCPPSTDDVTITVNDLPSLALAGPDQSLCNQTGATMAAVTAAVGTGTWTLVSGPDNPAINFPNLATTTVSGMIPGTYIFDWTIANGPCTSSDQAQIIIAATPTIANAGADQSLCGTSSATFDGNPAIVGAGTWTKVSGPGSPVITDINSEVSTITDLASGTYVFKWTISNGSCTVSSDNVQIAVTTGAVTLADAGMDQTGLALCGLTTATLTGNNPVTGIGMWSLHSGAGGVFGDPAVRNTTFSGNAGSTYVARWTITNGTCSSFDDVTIAFPKNPSQSVAGPDQNGGGMCGVTSALLAASTPLTGVGLWTIVSGAGGSFNNSSSPTATFSGSAGSVYSLKWTISNSPCLSSEDQVTVEFKIPPLPPSGSTPQSFCTRDVPDLNNITASGSNIKWYDASSGGNLLPGTNSLITGTTYYATQTVNGCESPTRLATAVSLYSCIGPVVDDVNLNLDENSPNGTIVFDENDANTTTDIDGDNDNIQYSIINGNSLGAFTINSSTGIISVTNSSEIDYEVNPVFVLTIRATDGLNEDPGVVTININNLNDNSPAAVSDTYSVPEGGILNTNSSSGVLNNDTDADGNALTSVLVSDVANGMLTLNADGSFSYTHDGSETVSDNFSYKVNDGTTDGNTVTVSITITPVNDVPVAVPDTYSLSEGGTLNINQVLGVLSNDTDGEANTLTSILVSDVSNGMLTLNADGSFTYTHDGTETTSDSFTYKVNDGTTDGNTVTVSIIITPVNDVPVAVTDTYSLSEGGTLNVNQVLGVLSNDTDAEANALTSILVSDVSNGILTLNANGSFTYAHDGSETTGDSFTYKVNDGTIDGNTVTVSITITPVNDVPVAVTDTYSLSEGGTLNVNQVLGVLSNDTDAEANALTSILVSDVSNGILTLNADGSFTYTHDGSETTGDSFTYKVNDGTTDGNTVTVSIIITPVNDSPVAVPDTYTLSEGGTLNINQALGVLNNDTDAEANALTSILVSDVSNGILTLNADGSFTYTHDGTETTSDSFTYKVNDGTTDGNTVTVSIIITPVNDSPVAVPDTYSLSEGGTLNINQALGVLNNDTDAEANALTSILVSDVSNGILTLNGDGSFTYTNNGSQSSSDTFTYKVNDGTTDGNTVTATILINPVNDAPVALPDTYSLAEGTTLNINAGTGVLINDTDPEADALTAILVSDVTNGSLTLNADGSFTYIHNGNETTSDSFTYKVNDGTTDGNTVTVTITIAAANDIPLAQPDVYSVAEGGTLIVNSVTGVLSNDTDADGDALSSVLVSDVSKGLLTLHADGSFNYTHDGSETSSDSFTYKANDGTADGNIVMVTIAITPVDDAPVASPDAYSVTEEGPLNIKQVLGVLSNDTDAEGNALTSILVSDVTNGTLTLNADGSFIYVHDWNKESNDNFSYKVNDGVIDGNTVDVSISINLTFNNHKPVAVADNDTTIQDIKKVIDVLLNDTGLEDGGILITIPEQPGNGTVAINDDNTVTYKPEKGFSGNDQFAYQICDKNGDCSQTNVEINVASNIFIPHGFSPNNDGINDYFEIPDLASFKQASVVIYNRWGNIVFEDKNYKNRWDGRSNKNLSGSGILPVGTYFYIIIIQDTGRKLNGYIYLTR